MCMGMGTIPRVPKEYGNVNDGECVMRIKGNVNDGECVMRTIPIPTVLFSIP